MSWLGVWYLLIDEIIVPRTPGQTWHHLISQLEKGKANYGFKTTYFFSDLSIYEQGTELNTPEVSNEIKSTVPSYLHMLSHIYRSKTHSHLIKSFIATEYVKSVGCHFATNCIENDKCGRQSVSSDIAHVHHYRKDCQRAVRDCNETYHNDIVKDARLWEFKKQLSFNCLQTINQLNITVWKQFCRVSQSNHKEIFYLLIFFIKS